MHLQVKPFQFFKFVLVLRNDRPTILSRSRIVWKAVPDFGAEVRESICRSFTVLEEGVLDLKE